MTTMMIQDFLKLLIDLKNFTHHATFTTFICHSYNFGPQLTAEGECEETLHT